MTSFSSTHTIPDQGLPAWPEPDGSRDPVARLDPWLPVAVEETRGAWARIRCENGWTAWVDGRRLVAVETTSPAAGPSAMAATESAAAPAGGPSVGAPSATTDGGAVGSYREVYRRARPAGRSPAAIAAQASAEAPTGRPPVTPVVIGALLVGAGGFLPWLTFPSTPSRGAPSIPIQFLVDIRTTADGPIDLIVPLLVAAAIGIGSTVVPAWARARRIAGWAVVVLASVFVGQLQRLLRDVGPGGPSLVEAGGIGILVTIAGGLVLALAADRRAGSGT